METTLQIVAKTPRPAHLIRVAVPRLNKQDHIADYLKQIETRDYDISWAQIDETVILSVKDWNDLMNSLMTDRDWLAGKGGCSSWAFADEEDIEFFKLTDDQQKEWKRTAFLHVIAVQCAGQTIYIDPQGYKYARYLAFAADDKPEGKTREELRREREKAEQAAKVLALQEQIANPPTVPADHGLKFLWNGIKVNGQLYRCYYSLGNLHHYPADTISGYARDYHSFPKEVRACFHVENNTEYQSDYFDNDRLRICSNHPLYSLAKQAYEACEQHHARRMEKRGLSRRTA